MTDYVIEQHDKPAYRAGYQAYMDGMDGKHLLIPTEHESEREAWRLGWNDAWTASNERLPS